MKAWSRLPERVRSTEGLVIAAYLGAGTMASRFADKIAEATALFDR
jgi:hypothetical protein